MALFSYSGQSLVPASVESDHVFVRAVVALNCRALSLCCLLKSFCWWAEHAVIPDVCPQPIAGAVVLLVCVVFCTFPQDRSHLGVVLTPFGGACTLPHLWRYFGWTPVDSVLEGEGLLENVEAGYGVSKLGRECLGHAGCYVSLYLAGGGGGK